MPRKRPVSQESSHAGVKGRTTARTRPAQSRAPTPPISEASEGENKGGRPLAIDDPSLAENRDAWIQLLAERWGEVGWPLECARTATHVHSLFRTLADNYEPSERLRPFLLETSEDGAGCRQTRRALNQAEARLYDLTPRVRREMDRLQESRALRKRPSAHADLLYDEHATRLRSLRRLRQDLRGLEQERVRLAARLDQQQADYTQRQLLAFIEFSPNRITPRNVAFAIAGLPYVGWRHSFRRCQDLESTHPAIGSLQAQLFELIASSWQRYPSEAKFLDGLRTNIERLRAGTCFEIAFRALVADDWRYLRQAVEATDLGLPSTPHRVFAALRRLREHASPEERLLAARERLPFATTDPSECVRIDRARR